MKKIKAFAQTYGNLFYLYKLIYGFEKFFFPLTLIGIILNALAQFPLIIFPKLIIDALVARKSLQEITFYIALMLGMSLVFKILIQLCKNGTEKMTEKIKNDLMLLIQQKSMNIPYCDVENPEVLNCRQTAMEIINPVNSGFMDFKVIIQSFNDMITNLLVIIGLLYLILKIDISFVLLITVVTIIHSFLTMYAKKKEFAAWENGLVTIARKLGYLQNISVNNAYAKEVRSYGLSDWVCNKIKTATLKAVKTVSKNIARYAGVAVCSNSMSVVLEGVSYAYIGILVIRKYFTIGDFSMLTIAVNTFFMSIIALSTNILNIYQTGIYLKEFRAFLSIEDDQKLTLDSGEKISDSDIHTIRFENVCFKYPGQEIYTLRGINLTIYPNQRLSIVGDNGAGKTTFIKLLLRLYDPTEGTIYMDGIDVRKMRYQEYISLFSVVFQDFKILAFSVLDNIVFDKKDSADMKRIHQILSDCGLEKNIERLPSRLDTMVSKLFDVSGVELSGGEQQKLALCNAVYKDASIVVLDEPTAMLSPTAEYEIYTSFDKIIGNKTAIYISHRMSSCRFCQNIVVFSHGHIVEYGSHDELIKLDKLYAEMFNAQADYYRELNS